MFVQMLTGFKAKAKYTRHITVQVRGSGSPNAIFSVYTLDGVNRKGEEIICVTYDGKSFPPRQVDTTETELLYGYTDEEMQNLVVRPFRRVTAEDVLIGQIRALTNQYRFRPASDEWGQRVAEIETTIAKLSLEVGETPKVLAETEKLHKQKQWWERKMARLIPQNS